MSSIEDKKLGDRCYSDGHHEAYYVYGYVNNEYMRYEIPKDKWEVMTEHDEFSYSKFRFGKKIWNLEIAQ